MASNVGKSAKELSAEYEKSEYNVHFFIKKTNSSNLTDIYVYVAAETEEGIRYVQSTSAKSLEGSATVSSTIKVTNGSSKSSKFAVNEIIVEDENVTHLNRIPKAFYVKVAYKETVNKEKVQHELNFKVALVLEVSSLHILVNFMYFYLDFFIF